MANIMRILVTGANGYVGNAICKRFESTHDIYRLTRDLVDLTDSKKVDEYFLFKQFDVIIHCAVQGGSRLKPETFSMMDANLQMYYNLLRHSDKFGKFIHIGSGAELYSTHTPYGLSKHVIRSSVIEKPNFYNLRVFGLFDENELESRFIKSNIKNYIERQPIRIDQVKRMDFMYMPDFLSIVERYIIDDTNPKEIDCCYETKYNLLAIANIINSLDEYSVRVDVKSNNIFRDYIGTCDQFFSEIASIGLQQGITNVYKILKERYETD
jgi:nucleoside-diphosphate-sugar epimerase